MRSLTAGLSAFVLFGMVASHAGGQVSYTFNSLTEQVMDTRVTNFASLQDEPFAITNNTGQTWIDFHVTLEGMGDFGGYAFMRFADLGSDGIIYTGPGTATFADDNGDSMGYDEVMNLDGLNVPDGSTLEFTADILGGAFPEGMTSFDIRGMPTVPEPATLGLLAAGLGALVAKRRKA